MKAGVLTEDGWREEALLRLFNHDFEPFVLNPFDGCNKCCRPLLYGIGVVEPRWYIFIEEMKLGRVDSCRGSKSVVEESTDDSDRRSKQEGAALETRQGSMMRITTVIKERPRRIRIR